MPPSLFKELAIKPQCIYIVLLDGNVYEFNIFSIVLILCDRVLKLQNLYPTPLKATSVVQSVQMVPGTERSF